MIIDVARRIRWWMEQNLVRIVGGNRERSGGGIDALMQGNVKMANLTENLGTIRRKAGGPLVTRFLRNFVPHCTKVMLQLRKCMVYVEFGK